MFLPATAVAAQSCPWLNAATAGGILGASVTMTVSRETANRDDAACSFTGRQIDLRIAVQTSETAHREFASLAATCGSDTSPLKAIGNEAVLCTSAANGARLIGRVRNRVFTILIGSTDPAAARSLLREKAQVAAEHVAGILF